MKPSFCAHCIDNPPTEKVGKFWLCAACAPRSSWARVGPNSAWSTSAAKRGAQYGGAGYLPTADEQDNGWGDRG